MRFVARDGRPAVAPQQVFQDDRHVAREGVQGVERRQVDQRDLFEADLDLAFRIGRADAGEALVMDHRAGGSLEDSALAGTRLADQRDARAASTPQQGSGKRKGVQGRHQVQAGISSAKLSMVG